MPSRLDTTLHTLSDSMLDDAAHCCCLLPKPASQYEQDVHYWDNPGLSCCDSSQSVFFQCYLHRRQSSINLLPCCAAWMAMFLFTKIICHPVDKLHAYWQAGLPAVCYDELLQSYTRTSSSSNVKQLKCQSAAV